MTVTNAEAVVLHWLKEVFVERKEMRAILPECLKSLAQERPIFHSEADFQHALAWHIQKTVLDSKVRFEFKPFHNENSYLDIWLPDDNVAIELKYKTRKLDWNHGDETFQLREQAAHDCGRYDFLQDVSRLEKLVDCSGQAKVGFAIFLTNDSRYWELPRHIKNPQSSTPNDYFFRIHDRRTINGNLEWCREPDDRDPRKDSICLKSVYDLAWKEYRCLGKDRAMRFRYLLVEVDPPTDLASIG